jgi:hypothetical protein
MLAMDWVAWSTGNNPVSAADKVYSYSGSLTRYAVEYGGTQANIMRPPDKAVANWQPGSGGTEQQGWVAVPMKRYNSTVAGGTSVLYVNTVVSSGDASITEVRSISGTGLLGLYMGTGTFMGTTGVLDMSGWRYIALKWNHPNNSTHTAELWVDGVQEVTGALARTSIATSFHFYLSAAGSFGDFPWIFGQIICYDDATDAGQTPYYVTRVSPNADGTNTGTWTDTSGSDHASVTDPFDAATYTQEASPSPNDLVEVLVNAGGADIGTQLGITPSSVQNVTLHTYSTGQLITARAELRDSAGSASVTNGPTETIDPTSTTYALVSADAPAAGGTWSGTDAPAFVYKVITT